MKRLFFIHCLLFAVYPPIFLFFKNVNLLPLSEYFLLAGVLVAGALALYFLLQLFIRNKELAALLTTFFLILFFSYGHIHHFVKDWEIDGENVGRHRYFFPFYWASGLALSYRALKTGKFYAMTRMLNNAGIFLLIQLLVMSYPKLLGYDQAAVLHELFLPQTVAASDSRLPDIYYIILDSYPRADVLKEEYGYDNSLFIEDLRRKGFYVLEQSRSNYTQTLLSMASVLNMGYLDDLIKKLDPASTNRNILIRLMRKSALASFLKSNGYATIAFSTGIWTVNMRNADNFLKPFTSIHWLQYLLIRTSALKPFLNLLPQRPEWLLTSVDQYQLHRKRILFTFEQLPRLSRLYRSPFLVYAHLIAPHPPVVFGKNGEALNPEGPFKWDFPKTLSYPERVSQYTAYLQFLNERVKMTIDQILQNSPERPIIILQSDHGADLGLVKHFTTEEKSVDNFSAYYLPDDGADGLYPQMSSVNTFRVILKHYFKVDMELLEDRSYYSEWDSPYKFIRVPDEPLKKGAL